MKILREFEAAVRADEMAGSQEPSDAEIIRKDFKAKKKEFKKLLNDVKSLCEISSMQDNERDNLRSSLLKRLK